MLATGFKLFDEEVCVCVRERERDCVYDMRDTTASELVMGCKLFDEEVCV